jgi:MYXO-CTERM domain-containing protein
VRAEDELAAASAWDSITFFVRGPNDPPAVPALLEPGDGASEVAEVVFVVAHAVDPEGDPVTYDILVARDAALTDRVAGGEEIEAGAGPAGTADQTSWQPTVDLTGDLYWSARATDHQAASSDWAAPRALTMRAPDLGDDDEDDDAPDCGCGARIDRPTGPWALLIATALWAIRRRRRGAPVRAA